MAHISGPADLRHFGAGRWRSCELLSPVTYEAIPGKADGTVLVPIGFSTDGASVPRLLWAIFPPMGPYLRAAIVHDYLYTRLKAGNPHPVARSRWAADRELRRAMAACGVGFLTRWIFWVAVRVGGWVYLRK